MRNIMDAWIGRKQQLIVCTTGLSYVYNCNKKNYKYYINKLHKMGYKKVHIYTKFGDSYVSASFGT
jgi:hypothetical protein